MIITLKEMELKSAAELETRERFIITNEKVCSCWFAG